jgi:ubiquinone/menaquinone biosynthesis C-methylase UbiE
MPEYNLSPVRKINVQTVVVPSFILDDEDNLDKRTVNSFGAEWNKFDSFKEEDLVIIGQDYFDLIKLSEINDFIVLDVGCGSGRWANFLSTHVKFIEAIDPSSSIFSAASKFISKKNIRFTQASVSNMPFADETFDLIYSLGVLHHIPDTEEAIKKCCAKLKKNGLLLVYLYYNLDNRGVLYRTLFIVSNLFRIIISRLPNQIKKTTCDIISIIVYWPLVQVSRLVGLFSSNLSEKMPLSYYKKTSFHIMRNDALDRFGTPLERRFSKKEIEAMLIRFGFSNIKFSHQKPYWHVIAQKA